MKMGIEYGVECREKRLSKKKKVSSFFVFSSQTGLIRFVFSRDCTWLTISAPAREALQHSS